MRCAMPWIPNSVEEINHGYNRKTASAGNQINSTSLSTPTAGELRPVRDVSYSIFPGQTLGRRRRIGLRKIRHRALHPPPHPFAPGESPRRTNPLQQSQSALPDSEKEMRSVRGKDIAMIFQEPMTSLNPVYTIGDQIAEAVTLHQHVGTREACKIAEKSHWPM